MVSTTRPEGRIDVNHLTRDQSSAIQSAAHQGSVSHDGLIRFEARRTHTRETHTRVAEPPDDIVLISVEGNFLSFMRLLVACYAGRFVG